MKSSAAIVGSNISFYYEIDGNLLKVLDDIKIEIQRSELIVILGKNGCGKSTLVKHFNALLSLQKGELFVSDINVKDESEIWKLRRLCGMVFQNPDNQFVSSIIEEDIAFGLENYQINREFITERVYKSLKLVGMEGFESRSPHTLSGGQKQKIALAGVLALNPDIIIFDEVTSMLDPESRYEILNTIKNIHKKENKTVIIITHYIEEAILADKIYVMNNGEIIDSGNAREVLTNVDTINKAELTLPFAVRVYYDLKNRGINLEKCPLTSEELVEELCKLKAKNNK